MQTAIHRRGRLRAALAHASSRRAVAVTGGLLAWLLMAAHAGAASGTDAGAPMPSATASGQKADCACPVRVKASQPTPEVLALFAAARQANEDAFLSLLPQVADINGHVVEGQPLMTALMAPARDLAPPSLEDDDKEGDQAWVRQQERRRLAHRATWPARLRMLDAALKQGVATSDTTWRAPLPALHLAVRYGSPQTVERLLAHGVAVNQKESDYQLTALELLLRPSIHRHVDFPNPITTREERAQIVDSLLKAGADLPEHVSWHELAQLIGGDQLIQALVRDGQLPSAEGSDQNPSPLSLAAFQGDAVTVAALKALLPRHYTASYPGIQPVRVDLWLDAAQAALLGGWPDVARSLLTEDMDWPTMGPVSAGYGYGEHDLRQANAPRTVLELAARRGDVELLRQLVDWGAPLDHALMHAVYGRHEAAVAYLVGQGAKPFARQSNVIQDTPLGVALEQDLALASRMLAAAGRRWADELRTQGDQAIRSLMRQPAKHAVSARIQMLDQLRAAGLDVSQISVDAVAQAIAVGEEALVIALVEAGASVTGTADHWPLLSYAMQRASLTLIDTLHRAGAPWPQDALARALATGRLDIVSHVAHLSGQTLRASCPSTYEELIPLVREPASFVEAALAQGLQTGPCSVQGDLAERMAASWLMYNAMPLIGSSQVRARALLKRLVEAQEPVWPAKVLAEAVQAHRLDVVQVLIDIARLTPAQKAQLADAALSTRQPEVIALLASKQSMSHSVTLPSGQRLSRILSCTEGPAFRKAAGLRKREGPCPATQRSPTPAEKTLARALAGHYYLSGPSEVGAELLLRPDGTFEYLMVYGADEQHARGRWRVQGRSVTLSPDKADHVAPFQVTQAQHDPNSQGVSVRLSYRGQLLRGLPIMIAGSERSVASIYPGRRETPWHAFESVGTPQALAVDIGPDDVPRWVVVNLPSATGQPAFNVFDLEYDGRFRTTKGMNGMVLKVAGKRLEFEAGGRTLVFAR